MTANGHDPLVEALGQLTAAPPRSIVDVIYNRWSKVDGKPVTVYVAFSDRGIDYLRTADSVHGQEAEFLESYRSRFGRPLRPAPRPPAGVSTALRTGRGRSLRFDLSGLSEFERKVLEAIQQIPVGQTRPYSWVAREIGRPRAARAVGSALGRNPVPVLIPCHRVTRADGEPGDYVFGRAAKEALLRAEEVNVDEVRELARSNVFYLGSDTTGIVCFPTCHNARRIIPEHRHGFRSIGQAAGAGYRPCLHCRPALAESA